MRHANCCVVNCKNTSKNSQCKFYRFPTAKWKISQRNKWIAAVKRVNPDGSPWVPKPYDFICSAHFIGGKKSLEELSPSYIPTIFPSTYKSSKVNETLAINRYKRKMNRLKKEEIPSTSNSQANAIEFTELVSDTSTILSAKNGQECEVDFYSNPDINSQTFIYNHYVKDDLYYAETQTEIVVDNRPIKIHIGNENEKYVHKECGSSKKTFADKESQTINKFINGFASLTKDQEIIHLIGVSFPNFDFLLTRLCTSTTQKHFRGEDNISKKDRLFIFLMKIKTGLTFSALGVLFNVHRTTISGIFYETLQHLGGATRNLVFKAVQETIPNSFLPSYSKKKFKK